MSLELFNRSPDLRKLRDEGYFVQVIGGKLVLREVPYVDSQTRVRTGTLISTLALAGDQTQKPDDHKAWFDGEFPCQADGSPLTGIANASGQVNLGHGLVAQHTFSNKPKEGYVDYHQKMTTYATILAGPAAVLKPGVTARTFRTPDESEDSVFNYIETASDRVGIGALVELLRSETVAIIGVGGTGSYVLDQIAKTPVREIRLFDADEFLQHNAFRAPGAPSIEELRAAAKKVDYLKAIYSKMHRDIVAHPVALEASNVHLLDGITFAFLSMDGGEPKRLVVEKLEALGTSFIDVGMGLELNEGKIHGILRITVSTPEDRETLRGKVSFAGSGGKDIYASNIQVAELNALNAMLAVLKWKKLRGIYHDFEKEMHCTYTIDGNMLVNGDGT